MRGSAERRIARALWYWWVTVIVAGGLGNTYLAIRFFQSGFVAGGLLFAALAGACCVYCYRTYKFSDEAQAIFRK